MRDEALNKVVDLGSSYFSDNTRPAEKRSDAAKPHTPKVIKLKFDKRADTAKDDKADQVDAGSKSRRPGYNSWAAMKQRVENKNHRHYADYGGRGIKYDHNWQSFDRFIWDMGPPPGPGYSLERLDVDGDYCKSNCVWANAKQQARNRRSNRLIQHNGEERTLSELAEENGLSPSTLSARLARGLSVEQATTTPIKHGGVPLTQFGVNFDKWPSNLAPQTRLSLEEDYLQRADHAQRRPQYFMARFSDHYSDAVATMSANPDEVPDEACDKAMKLIEAYQEAQVLGTQVSSEAFSVSKGRCPCCGQYARRM